MWPPNGHHTLLPVRRRHLPDCDGNVHWQSFHEWPLPEVHKPLSWPIPQSLPPKIQGIATATPYISYRSNDFSSFHFCPFKSFCFSYRIFRSLQSSFIRSSCARTPFRQSGSNFLYSPGQIALLEVLYIFIKYFCRKLSVLCLCSHIVFITDLQNNLMERLFLLFANIFRH